MLRKPGTENASCTIQCIYISNTEISGYVAFRDLYSGDKMMK